MESWDAAQGENLSTRRLLRGLGGWAPGSEDAPAFGVFGMTHKKSKRDLSWVSISCRAIGSEYVILPKTRICEKQWQGIFKIVRKLEHTQNNINSNVVYVDKVLSKVAKQVTLQDGAPMSSSFLVIARVFAAMVSIDPR